MTDWLINRLMEPSTWRGFVYILTGAGIALSPAAAEAVITAGLTAAGLINVLKKDAKSKDAN